MGVGFRQRVEADKAEWAITDWEVESLRVVCRHRGADLSKVVDWPLRCLIYRCRRDLDLAATAVVMRPRPDWVFRLIGADG